MPRPRLLARLLTCVVAAAAMTALTISAPAQAATPVPPTPAGLPAGAEALASYVGASSCDASAKPGSAALGALLLKTYPGTSYNSPRACGSDSLATSEHYDGRAVDWMVSVRNTVSRDRANATLAWMLATDTHQNTYAMARRLGVMYIIWNNRSWSAYNPSAGWKEYNGCLATAKAGTGYDTTCHRDHVHFSLSWAGAMKRTSYWTNRVAAPEFGPCRTPGLNWALPNTAVNLTRCPSYPAVTARATTSALGKRLVGYSGMYLRQGSTGPAVNALQSAVGAPATSSFSATTRSKLLAWQRAHGVPVNGVTDAWTWAVMVRQHINLPAVSGLDGDLRPDLLALESSGRLSLHTSTGDVSGRTIGTGWGGFNAVLTPGDLTGDFYGDVLARRGDGTLWLYSGTASGVPRSGVNLGGGWMAYNALLAPGDLTGDGWPDLLARKTDGTLWLVAGAGSGRLRAPVIIATSWQIFSGLVSPGDVTGDGRPDVLARRTDGAMWIYTGTTGGRLAFVAGSGSGWAQDELLFSAGDSTGDGRSDLLGRTPAGDLLVHAGNGAGQFAAGSRVSRGWNAYRNLVGAR